MDTKHGTMDTPRRGRPPIGQERRSRALQVLVTEQQFEEVLGAALADGETVSTWCQEAIIARLRKRRR